MISSVSSATCLVSSAWAGVHYKRCSLEPDIYFILLQCTCFWIWICELFNAVIWECHTIILFLFLFLMDTIHLCMLVDTWMKLHMSSFRYKINLY
jgi:hypothetical protein